MLRPSDYGSTEIGYREPGGHFVTFAQFALKVRNGCTCPPPALQLLAQPARTSSYDRRTNALVCIAESFRLGDQPGARAMYGAGIMPG
jgi:hypothetical protein